VRHDEKVAHDAHLNVSCRACHLRGVIPVKDAASGQVRWGLGHGPEGVSRIHQMVRGSEGESCRRCHVNGNQVGAAARVLPAKSVICMPCHPATLSVGDTTTTIALLLFLVGFVGVGSVWFSASLDAGIERRDENKFLGITKGILRALSSLRLFSIAGALILDGLLQRRHFRQAKARWAIHALIFLPFAFRFVWGLAGLIASLCRPDWPGTWILLDKNHPATAFLFDLTGGMVILGILCAVVRRTRRPAEEILAGMPRPDWAANGLLAGIVIVGFLLEGMRIAMAGSPSGAEFAFVGYGLSRLFSGVDLTGLYGYVWYTHAILTGVFVAYLPFSRMLHMITVPIALALNAGSKHGD
jgi:nitrate reductase gamma subunit